MKIPDTVTKTNIILGQFYLYNYIICSHSFQLVTITYSSRNKLSCNKTPNCSKVCCPRALFGLVSLSCRCRPSIWYMASFCEDGNESSDSMKVGNLLCTQLWTNSLRKVLYNGIPRNHAEKLICYGLEGGPQWLLLWLVAVRPDSCCDAALFLLRTHLFLQIASNVFSRLFAQSIFNTRGSAKHLNTLNNRVPMSTVS
jgi:hypothetical protein